MGALLSLRHNQDPAANVFVDFENAAPSAVEQETYDAVARILEASQGVLNALRDYQGCGEQIRKAISTPSTETEDEAWRAVCPCVARLKEFYEYSLQLEEAMPLILQSLCAGDVIKNLEERQALAKQFADVLHFVLLFDDLKMTNPAIQNDFSYYRRTLNRMKLGDSGVMDDLIVRDELANRMSLYYAYPTPMLKTITTATSNFVTSTNSIPSENVTECLSTMAIICHNAIAKQRFTNPETIAFCLQVMVGCIILYDHVHQAGAFVKASPINIKSSIKLIQTHGSNKVDGLLNALRYTTKHLNDDETPKGIKTLLSN